MVIKAAKYFELKKNILVLYAKIILFPSHKNRNFGNDTCFNMKLIK